MNVAGQNKCHGRCKEDDLPLLKFSNLTCMALNANIVKVVLDIVELTDGQTAVGHIKTVHLKNFKHAYKFKLSSFC